MQCSRKTRSYLRGKSRDCAIIDAVPTDIVVHKQLLSQKDSWSEQKKTLSQKQAFTSDSHCTKETMPWHQLPVLIFIIWLHSTTCTGVYIGFCQPTIVNIIHINNCCLQHEEQNVPFSLLQPEARILFQQQKTDPGLCTSN